jgi:ketosteroid isomerase-like protein
MESETLSRDTERAMSEETLDLARAVMEALSQRDLARLTALASPDVEWHSFFAGLGEGGVYRGHEGTRRYLHDLDEAWEIVRADVDDGIAVGDVALLVGRIHYRGRGSGAETETPAGWMLKFRTGKVVRFRAFREPDEALQAAGLSE